ncbi:insulinase family protein [bacterium]|nr:insulinase family protein [bacterium]
MGAVAGGVERRFALAAVAEVLQTLKDEPPSAEELARAKIRTERSHRFSRETVQGTSSLLGWHDAMGDLASAFTFPEQVATVTGADVCRICRRLFSRDGCSVLLYAPRDGAGNGLPAEAAAVDALMAPHLDDDRSAAPRATAAPPIPAPGSASAAVLHDRPFEETVLDGGLRLYLREDHTLPIVTVGLHAAGGVCLQASGQEGLAHLCQHVQVKGAGGVGAAALHSRIESLGASLSPFTARDHNGIYLTGLTRHLDELIGMLGGLACSPDFPGEELERERSFALADLKAMDDDPFQAAARELRAAIYPEHPYGSPVLGEEESLAALTGDDLRDFHRRTWVSRNLHVVVSGAVDADRIAGLLEDSLADLAPSPAPALPDLSIVPGPSGETRRRLTRDVRQSVVLSAWPGPATPNDDRASLALLQQLLNGQSGRLFESLRNRRSLCYAVGLQSSRGFAPGMLVGYVLTDPATENEAAAALTAEIGRMADEPVPSDEFARARSQLVGNLLIARQSNSARASRCAADVLYGRPPNNLAHYLREIRTLTPSHIRETAARYLGRDEVLTVVLGPAL